MWTYKTQKSFSIQPNQQFKINIQISNPKYKYPTKTCNIIFPKDQQGKYSHQTQEVNVNMNELEQNDFVYKGQFVYIRVNSLLIKYRSFNYSKFKLIFLMQDELTTFLLQFTLLHKHTQEKETIINQELMKTCVLSSQQLLSHIFETLNCTQNYRDDRKHRFSLSSDQTGSHTQTKCNCKKSKCLKLYCQCFAQGSLCKNCNCDCCQNTQQYSQIRAKAIDQLIMRTTFVLGPKGSTLKGCNCKKTGCLKKYCQCFNAGQKCGEYCKCNNCSNCE